MKIWPFDEYAERTGGQHISTADLERGLEPFRQIRQTTGNEVDVIAELHSKWNLPTALRIARALEPYQPMWVEDPLRMDSLDALARFCAEVTFPTAASETMGSARMFKSMIEQAGVQVVLFDPAWAGGISESLEDRRPGRRPALAGSRARLHRSSQLRGRRAPFLQSRQYLRAGGGTGVLPRLVPRPRHRAAPGRGGQCCPAELSGHRLRARRGAMAS